MRVGKHGAKSVNACRNPIRSYGNAELTQSGSRSSAQRNEYQVSANNNPGMSVPPEREDVL